MKLCKRFWLRLLAVAVALTCVFALSGKIQAASSRFGDIDKNGVINQDDAVRLLLHALLPEYYPLHGVSGDMDGNNVVNQEDAVRLLLHALLPDYYPLNPPASDDDDEEVGPTVGENGTPIV